MAKELDTVADYSSSETRQHTTLSERQNDQPDISDPSKVMPRVILNRVVNQAEQILEEEQADFRSYQSTTEQTFNLRLLVEKHWVHQKELVHNFIDFKKAFDRVWRVLKE